MLFWVWQYGSSYCLACKYNYVIEFHVVLNGNIFNLKINVYVKNDRKCDHRFTVSISFETLYTVLKKLVEGKG